MNANTQLAQPLQIEITEAEILADLLYPASPPRPAPEARDHGRGDGRHAARGGGGGTRRRGPAIPRDRAAA